MWLMNSSSIESSVTVTYQGNAVKPDSTWNIIEVGNFNDPTNASDVLWQQSTTGTLMEWQMNGAQIVSSQQVTSQGVAVTPNGTWQAQAKPADFA
jgi:serralysin